jgi:hypothetical protein
MKKLITFICLLFVVSIVSAQDLKSKKGEPILPEAGDWAFGIDAAPFLNYIHPFKSPSPAPAAISPTGSWENNPSIPFSMVGKKFINATTAYRVRVRLSIYNANYKNNVFKDGSTDPDATVQDKFKIRSKDITVGVGMEKRKGKTRLQGFYGAEAYLNFGGSANKYEYGNSFSSTNTSPTSTLIPWTSNPAGGWNSGGLGSRTLEVNNGSHLQVGARGFIGIEYFIFVKTSIGFEFGWGAQLYKGGAGKNKAEGWDGTAAKTTETEIAGSSNFSFDHENIWTGNSLNITYHF